MMEVDPSTLTKWAKKFYDARGPSDIETSEGSNGSEELSLTNDEEVLVSELESEEEVDFVGFGGNRISFSLPNSDQVVLFPRWGPENDTLHNGKECNLNEIEIWTNLVEANKEDEFNFLPVNEYNDEGWWVIKPTITPVVEDSADVNEYWENGGKEELWDNVFAFNEYINMMDVTKHNACLRDGEFVLFDYGTKPQN